MCVVWGCWDLSYVNDQRTSTSLLFSRSVLHLLSWHRLAAVHTQHTRNKCTHNANVILHASSKNCNFDFQYFESGSKFCVFFAHIYNSTCIRILYIYTVDGFIFTWCVPSSCYCCCILSCFFLQFQSSVAEKWMCYALYAWKREEKNKESLGRESFCASCQIENLCCPMHVHLFATAWAQLALHNVHTNANLTDGQIACAR